MKNYHFKNPQSSTAPKKDKHREIHTKTYHNQITESQRQIEKFERKKGKMTHYI